MTYEKVLSSLKKLANPLNVEGMARFGISSEGTLGVSVADVRALAKTIEKNHELAEQLWQSKIHEARILASIIDKPEWVTEAQMESWVVDFDSWDICDQVCGNLFSWTPFATAKVSEWAQREETFVRRAAFALIAYMGHNKKIGDEQFRAFFPLIAEYAFDDRNFVKKAVNWALRTIGKRNEALRKEAIKVATNILEQPHPAAKWIARDALRELRNR